MDGTLCECVNGYVIKWTMGLSNFVFMLRQKLGCHWMGKRLHKCIPFGGQFKYFSYNLREVNWIGMLILLFVF